MNVATRNRKAKNNGLTSEKKAEDILKEVFDTAKLEFINQLIDYYVNGHYIEVKSCLSWQVDKTTTTKRRRGRFVLDEGQHRFLIENNGYYLFVVNCPSGRSYFKLMPASKIEFKRLLPWTAVFDETELDEEGR